MSRKKSERLHDAGKYEVLAAVYAKDGTQVDHRSVGAYRTKVVRAGEMLYVQCYPLIGSDRRREQEEALKQLEQDRRVKTTAKYARYNNSRRILAFEQLVHANFVRGDLHVACTYDRQPCDRIPPSEWELRTREETKRDVDNFIRRVKRLLVRHGVGVQDFKWIKVTVTKHRDQEALNPFPDTHHHHVLLHGVPESLRGDVERLWPYGYCNADRLQSNDSGVAQMAGYIARQEGSANGDHAAGEKSWTGSRNLEKPTVKTSDAKISRRRAAKIAEDVRANAYEIFGKLYPGYKLTEFPKVSMTDFAAGAYIRARLIRIDRD